MLKHERLVLLAGHAAAVAAAIKEITQQLEVSYGQSPNRDRRLAGLIVELTYAADYYIEEVRELSEEIFEELHRKITV